MQGAQAEGAMVFVPRDYESAFEVARRAASAAGAEGVGIFTDAAFGPAWNALHNELATDKAHGPQTVRAYAWRPGSATTEIPAACWQRGLEREWKRRNHASLRGQGWRMEGHKPSDDGDDADMHVMFDGSWVLPVLTRADAEAFVARYVAERVGAAQESAPAEAAASTHAAERRMRDYLEGRMRASPKKSPGTKEAVRAEAEKAGHKVSDRAFLRAWANAVTATGATAWSQPGRKS
jgi:hypothetical protein